MDSTCNITRFQERDVDFMLAEELRVNPDFSRWFVNHGGGGFECLHPATDVQINVVEDGGESDVIATFRDAAGHKYKLFVENKTYSGKEEDQLERYVRRADNEKGRGDISDYAVKFFTPAAYPDKNCPDGVQNTTFEQAAGFLKGQSDDIRYIYKADFLLRAANQTQEHKNDG